MPKAETLELDRCESGWAEPYEPRVLDDLTIKVSVAGRAIPAHRHRVPVATRACGQRRGGRSLTISYCRGSGVRRTLVIRAQCAPRSRTSAATWTTTPTIQGTSSPSLASATGWRRGRRRESRFPVARRSLRSSVPTRHTTGIESPWCADRLPSHNSKTVVSTVSGGGPKWTIDRTIFELWLGTL